MKRYRVNLQEAYILTKEFFNSSWYYRIGNIDNCIWSLIDTIGAVTPAEIIYMRDDTHYITLKTKDLIDSSKHLALLSGSFLEYFEDNEKL